MLALDSPGRLLMLCRNSFYCAVCPGYLRMHLNCKHVFREHEAHMTDADNLSARSFCPPATQCGNYFQVHLLWAISSGDDLTVQSVKASSSLTKFEFQCFNAAAKHFCIFYGAPYTCSSVSSWIMVSISSRPWYKVTAGV